MSETGHAPATTGMAAKVLTRLADAAGPLALKELAKGLPPRAMPKGTPKAEKDRVVFDELRAILDPEVAAGRVYAYPSGAKGETRYWVKDEQPALEAVALAWDGDPLPVAKLAGELKKRLTKPDAGFAETVVRGLIDSGRLHQHPPKGKSGDRYSPVPPPPPPHPLALPANAKKLDKLAADCEKLMGSVRVSAADVLAALAAKLGVAVPLTTAATHTHTTHIHKTRDEYEVKPFVAPPPPPPARSVAGELEQLILDGIGRAPVVSLADLRAKMPAHHRGSIFDETVLKMHDDELVVVRQDARPGAMSDDEQAGFVRDGDTLFTTISRRS